MHACKESALCSLHFIVFGIMSFRIVMTEGHSCLQSRKGSSWLAHIVGSCQEGPAPQHLKGWEGAGLGRGYPHPSLAQRLGCTHVGLHPPLSEVRLGDRVDLGSSFRPRSLWSCSWADWSPGLVRIQQKGSSECRLQGHARNESERGPPRARFLSQKMKNPGNPAPGLPQRLFLLSHGELLPSLMATQTPRMLGLWPVPWS